VATAVAKQERVVTLVTLLLVALWFVLSIARIWKNVPQAVALDSIMPIVIGYWFAMKKSGDNE